MANCSYITQSIGKGCRDNTGGIQKLYVFAAPISGYTFSADTDGITDYINTIGAVSGSVYTYDLQKATSNFVEAATADLAAGTIFYQQTIQVVFWKWRQEIRNQLYLLGTQTNIVAVVEDNNGNYFLCGKDFGMTMSSSNAQSGTAYGDSNSITITFEGLEKYPAYQLLRPLSQSLVGITLVPAD